MKVTIRAINVFAAPVDASVCMCFINQQEQYLQDFLNKNGNYR